ncbi:DUF4397 domain-containing protein [uncultured Cytophaga sp.]|uniref:DUF4397 domain-containing protein n=1 Tax=uncultured Cytophaga sp. TaxID=160238 RepID=UPI002605E48E|nr:DUF4397 domain-containing protein [uncultured Cytophaga sp.]
MFKYYILAFAIASSLFVSCKKDNEDAPAPTLVIPKNTSVLIVNAISDNSSAISFKLDNDAIATVGSDSYSAYIRTTEGTHNLIFTIGGTSKTLPVTIEQDKYYTLVVYGTSAQPSVTVIEDVIGTPAPTGQFAYRYLNVYDSSIVKTISSQAYYPTYALWATVTGTHENIAFGTASAFGNYTAGIEAQWRIIESGTETDEPLAGYKSGSTHIVYAPTDKALGTEGEHFTYVIFGHGTVGSYKLIVHEDQVVK